MSLPASRLQRVLNDAPVSFRLGDYISQGFQFMNQNFGLLLAFMLVSALLGIFAQFVPIIGIVLSLLISPVLQIGYSQFTYSVKKGAPADFSEFFKGFNKIGPLVGTYFLTGLAGLVAILPGLFLWYQAGMVDWIMSVMEDYSFPDNAPDIRESVDMSLFVMGLLLVMAGGFVITILFAWALNIVWFYDLGPIEALSASRKLIARNWFSFLIFVIVAGFIAACGILLCGVGVLYTAPAMAVAQFFAFADSARLFESDEAETSDPIDHFIA